MPLTHKFITSSTVGSNTASVVLSGIPQNYSDLVIYVSSRSTRTGGGGFGDLMFRFNSDTGNNYSILSNGGATTTNGFYFHLQMAADGNPANTFSYSNIHIPNYSTTLAKSVLIGNSTTTNTTNNVQRLLGGYWTGTAAITSITFFDGNSSLIVPNSTFYVYGILRA